MEKRPPVATCAILHPWRAPRRRRSVDEPRDFEKGRAGKGELPLTSCFCDRVTPPRVGADAVFIASDFLGVCAVLDRIMGPMRQRLAWYGMGRIGWVSV